MFEGLRTVLQVPPAAKGLYKTKSKNELTGPAAPATRRRAKLGQHPGCKRCPKVTVMVYKAHGKAYRTGVAAISKKHRTKKT